MQDVGGELAFISFIFGGYSMAGLTRDCPWLTGSPEQFLPIFK
jgi:hypothetical protein